MSILTDTLINGPINIIRMEGYVNNIKKVAYFFLDYHIGLQFQTRCPSFTSMDLYQYLANNLKNTEFPIDFMFEITQSYLNKSPYNFKDIYIREVVDFFNSQYNNKNNKNIRYHFIDIRDYVYNTVNQYTHVLDNIIDDMNRGNNYNIDTVNDIKYYLNSLMSELNYWEELIFGNFNDVKKNTIRNLKRLGNDKQLNQMDIKNNIKEVPKFIFKIRERYNHKEVRDKLQDIFDLIKNLINKARDLSLNIVELFEKHKHLLTDDFILQYDKYLETFSWFPSYSESTEVIKSVTIEYRKLYYIILKLFTNLMDIYFLRRFLDKDYIQHAIIYTGCAHSINYIQHLLTKYDFKITHASYSLEKDMDKLNEHLKKFNNTADRREYEKYLYIPKLIQCSSVEHFPKNFE